MASRKEVDRCHKEKEGKLDEKASQLHAIASLRVLLDAAKANGGYPSGVNVPPAGGCCASCSQCPQCVTCPTCQRPLVRPTPAPQLDTATPLNTYIVTTSDYPPPHSPLSTIGGASASGAKRQGQDPLTNVQSLQVYCGLSRCPDQGLNMLFCFKLGKSPKETYEMLKEVYKDEAIASKSVYEWFKRFQEGGTSLEDAPRGGRPKSTRTPENILRVKQACGKQLSPDKVNDCLRTENQQRKCSPHTH
ncbi:hypothetical protein TNCV_3002691 [Trichonephila clavipes]|nr:hypothetical protein TNCV_3002691 [Trichonephila clavipes]